MAHISEQMEQQLLGLLQTFLEEMGAARALKRLSLTADFESDLGIDSLGRIEFIHRVEELTGTKLSTAVFGQAQNLKDVIKFLSTSVSYEDLAKLRLPDEARQQVSSHIPKGRTLVDSLLTHVKHMPDAVHLYFMDEDGSEKPLTYRALHDRAMKVAGGLVARGLRHDETVAIMLPTSLDFFVAFFGILLAGAIPVPIYPPFRPNKLEEYVLREANLLRNAGAKFLITFDQAETLSYLIQGMIPSMEAVVTVEDLCRDAIDFTPPVILPSDPAFIQYTSGSTGNPKGVLLTHNNILANLNAVGEAIQVSSEDRVVSWLPLYHDMGLIGCWFGSLYFSVPLAVMSPLNFISRPESWLWAIHSHKATLTAAPNFAYELCIRRVKDKDIQGLDLSSLRLMLNGAEAIQPETLRRFIERFEPYGLKPNVIFPVYGLAESTVALTFPPLNRSYPRIDRIKRDDLEFKRQATPAAEDDPYVTEFVACGHAIPGHQVKIVDKDGNLLPERTVGRLLFQGPSSMRGYYNNPDATAAISFDGWIDSGDYAYLAEGDIFITGRTKDLIIKAGKNIYPDDIEDITGRVNGIRKGRVIAFGIMDQKAGTEKLVVVAETLEQEQEVRDRIIAEITANMVTELGTPPDEVVLAPPGTIPKTSSGKLQRSACKADYLKGTLLRKSKPVWFQLARIGAWSTVERIKKFTGFLGRLLFTTYVGLVATPIVLLALLGIAIGTKSFAQMWAHGLLRFLFVLVGWRLKVQNRENLYKHKPFLFVANHASYLDAIIMMALLPPDTTFVAKREVVSFGPFRWLFKKLGHLTVERQDIHQGLSDLEIMEKSLREGHSLMIFPEGTFVRTPGLRAFKSGAFKLATDTNTPVCPIAINGARDILPDEAYLLKPRAIYITVYESIYPESSEWSEVLRVSALAREQIAKGCGEPVFEAR